MIVLGIDPGSHMGVARVKVGNTIEVLETETLRDFKGLARHITAAELVAIEWWQYQGPKRGRGVPHAAEWSGKVAGYVTCTTWPYVTVTRTEVLRGLNLPNHAGKDDVKRRVRALTSGVAPSNDHEADAVAVAIVGSARHVSLGGSCAPRSHKS